MEGSLTMLSASGVGLEYATLLSTSIECILYGISLAMFGGTVWTLAHDRSRHEINWPMASVALILTIFSTIHVAVDVQRLVVGFVTGAGFFPGGPTGFFADMTQRTFIIKSAVYMLQTLLGDGIVIYRCYVVWQRVSVVVLPAVLWCATFATSIGLLYHISHATGVLPLDVGKWIVSFNLLTMTTNTLSSALLAYRIWATNRNQPGVVRVLSRSAVDAMRLPRILMDAAMLYTLTLFVLLACYACRSGGQFIVLDVATPMVSITFYMVLVRIAVARSGFARVPPPASLSPLRFAARGVPGPSERRLNGARRSSI